MGDAVAQAWIEPAVRTEGEARIPRVAFVTLGCKVNRSETEVLEELFLRSGYRVVPFESVADVYVVNTCTVTHVADQKSRQLLRRAARRNPRAVVVAAGCYVDVAPEEVARVEGVDLVVSQWEEALLPQKVAALLRRRGLPVPAEEGGAPSWAPAQAGTGQGRIFVKVQDGCDKRCAYCIVTVARGRSRSRPLEEVVAEVRRRAEEGYGEVVLTGVDLGDWRDGPRGGRRRLADLVRAILEDTPIPRLRLSSLDPSDARPELLELLAHPRMAPHLHLPLQSGSARILRRMRRRYNPDQFRRAVERARAVCPDVAITTDVMVGFPGETEEDFEATLRLVEEMALARLHVFPFSPRQGTEAAGMADQVPAAVKKARVARLLAVGRRLQEAYVRAFLGQVRRVLFEEKVGIDERGRPLWSGWTDNYIRVYVAAPRPLAGRFAEARLEALRADLGVWGRLA